VNSRAKGVRIKRKINAEGGKERFQGDKGAWTGKKLGRRRTLFTGFVGKTVWKKVKRNQEGKERELEKEEGPEEARKQGDKENSRKKLGGEEKE